MAKEVGGNANSTPLPEQSESPEIQPVDPRGFLDGLMKQGPLDCILVDLSVPSPVRDLYGFIVSRGWWEGCFSNQGLLFADGRGGFAPGPRRVGVVAMPLDLVKPKASQHRAISSAVDWSGMSVGPARKASQHVRFECRIVR